MVMHEERKMQAKNSTDIVDCNTIAIKIDFHVQKRYSLFCFYAIMILVSLYSGIKSTYERRENAVQLFYGVPEDIGKWMRLVTQVRRNFPGLETQEKLDGHRATVLKFMDRHQAVCVKEGNEIAGVMLFSKKHNMICCLAVSPGYRRRGVASMLMDEALASLDRTKEISVSTFQAGDEKGVAPRALYEKYGFVEDALIEEMGYPSQKYILHPAGAE